MKDTEEIPEIPSAYVEHPDDYIHILNLKKLPAFFFFFEQ